VLATITNYRAYKALASAVRWCYPSSIGGCVREEKEQGEKEEGEGEEAEQSGWLNIGYVLA
jgi:pyruvoyl-dependent arginine decarboxylase (PvlArgDC)